MLCNENKCGCVCQPSDLDVTKPNEPTSQEKWVNKNEKEERKNQKWNETKRNTFSKCCGEGHSTPFQVRNRFMILLYVVPCQTEDVKKLQRHERKMCVCVFHKCNLVVKHEYTKSEFQLLACVYVGDCDALQMCTFGIVAVAIIIAICWWCLFWLCYFSLIISFSRRFIYFLHRFMLVSILVLFAFKIRVPAIFLLFRPHIRSAENKSFFSRG